MRLGIDARLCGVEHRGIGRYTEELVKSLLTKDGDIELVIFLSPQSACKQILTENNIEFIEIDAKPYSWNEQKKFLKALNQANCDLVHFPHFNVPLLYKKPYVVTIHDLILHHFPNRNASTLNPLVYWIKYFIYRLVLWSTIKRAKKIIAVSEYTKEDILDHYTISKSKVEFIPEVVDQKINSYEEKAKIWYNKYGEYALYVGAAYPHKNVSRLISAWKKVGPKTNRKLILVVPADDFGQKLQRQCENEGLLDQPNGVSFVHSPDDQTLHDLYAESDCVINPSLFEGVGLPGLESFVHNKRLISSAESAMGEVYGKRAVYISVSSSINMEKNIINAINASKLEQNASNYPIILKSELAEKLVNIYRRCFN